MNSLFGFRRGYFFYQNSFYLVDLSCNEKCYIIYLYNTHHISIANHLYNKKIAYYINRNVKIGKRLLRLVIGKHRLKIKVSLDTIMALSNKEVYIWKKI